MANFDLEAAKAAGYSDADISRIQQGIEAARGAGYSDEEIQSHLAGRGPPPVAVQPPAGSPLPATLRWPLGAGASATAGLTNTLALPGAASELAGSGLNWLAERTLPEGAAKLLSEIGHGSGFGDLITPAEMTRITDKVGLTNNPALAAQSEPERLAQAAAGGVGSTLPLLPLGAAGPLLASGGAGGVASEAARSLGAPELLQVGAGVGAGLGVQGITSLLGRGISHIASDLGSSATLQEAGEYAQDSARHWLGTTLPAKLEAAWSPVDAAIPASHPVDLAGFRGALEGISTSAGGLAPLEKLLRPALPERLKEVLLGGEGEVKIPPMARPGRVSSERVAGLPSMNPQPGPATPVSSGRIINPPGVVGTGPAEWSEASRLRSALGDAMSNPKVVNDIGTQNLSRLYASLTGDMQTAAIAVGPRAGLAFLRANAESSRLYGIAEGPVARIVSGAKASVADDPKPGDVSSYFLNKARRDGTDLSLLRSEMPDVVDELAAAHLRLNPDARAWSRLAPEAQAALVPSEADRGIISSTFTPRIPRGEMVERSIRDLLIGGVVGHAAAPGLPPFAAEAIGTTLGAALPYVAQGARQAIRNPLLGIAGGVAGENALTRP